MQILRELEPNFYVGRASVGELDDLDLQKPLKMVEKTLFEPV